jgi:peptidyl-prolyl cis-trans isomerase C
MKRWINGVLAGALALGGSAAWAEAESPQEEDVFARLGETVLTHEMLDAAFSRIPAESRLAFIRDGSKVDTMVKQILRNLALADAARAAGLDQDPMVKGRMRLSADKELAEAWLAERVRQAPDADYESWAREYYLLNRERYQAPATYDVTHLLVGTRARPVDKAKQLAQDLLAQVMADPGSFEDLVMEHSDDPSVVSNRGSFTRVGPGEMVAPFEQAALALPDPGAFSGLVETQFGFHIIRLDGKHPARQLSFEEVRGELVSIQKAGYQDEVRKRVMTEAISQPLVVPQEAVEKMLKRYFGEELENAPSYGGG